MAEHFVVSNSDLWIFGYGSLMWNPGFEYLEAHRARLNGVHRAPCIHSWVHRGTRERPGIVLGLAPGGSCIGMAFRVHMDHTEETIEYLRARELVTNVYVETHRSCRLDTGETVTALTYVADTRHDQYAGKLAVSELAQTITGAVGGSGPNEEYILGCVAKMRAMHIRDGLMEAVEKRLLENSA